MKTILSLILATALMAAMFTGCGCAANVSTDPNGMITGETTRPAIMPTPTATHETTRPTHATMPADDGTRPSGSSAPTGGNTAPTAESTMPTDQGNARGRGMMPNR